MVSSFGCQTRRQPDDVARRGTQGTKRGNGHGNRYEGGDWNEDEDGNGHEGRDGVKKGSRNGDKKREGVRGEREPGNLRSDDRGVSKDARRGATPTSDQQAQPEDPTPQRGLSIMRRTKG